MWWGRSVFLGWTNTENIKLEIQHLSAGATRTEDLFCTDLAAGPALRGVNQPQAGPHRAHSHSVVICEGSHRGSESPVLDTGGPGLHRGTRGQHSGGGICQGIRGRGEGTKVCCGHGGLKLPNVGWGGEKRKVAQRSHGP